MNRFIVFSLAISVLFMTNCNQNRPENGSDNPKSVSFLDRSIDLQPYVEGFPYSGFRPFYAAGKLFYMKRGATTQLLELDLSGKPNLEKGKPVSDIDYATRNVRQMLYNDQDGHLYWQGDERNDEIFNLFRLNPETGEIEKITDVPYIFGSRWNKEKDKIAYIARLGRKNERLGELRVLDLKTGEEEIITQDTPEMRFTWGSPSWQPDGKGIVVMALKDADRTYGNLVYVDLESGEKTLLTDESKPRSFPAVEKEWLNDHEFLYLSNEDGFRNAYTYDLNANRSKQLTLFQKDLKATEVIEIDGESFFFCELGNPIENELFLINLNSGEILANQKVDFELGVLDSKDHKMMVSITSNASIFQIDELTVTKEGFAFETVIDVPASLKEKIYQATPERLTYPTFDIDPATGEPRELHAYLYKPKKPLPKGQELLIVQSFYGGGNSFNMRYQILAEAGIYVLSPSPRGSAGFGREFAAMNNKDLGGNEIIDIFYAAKYISEKLGIPPQRIGVFGGSHGGYATMRVLTFPGEINGNQADFDWGFGMSHAGFSDIIHFYEHCNIPDWVLLEAGDPKTEAEKLKDRSPLYHADKLKGKLLLTHGTNDSRVPIEGSRMMADSLRHYGKDVTLVEFEGQGHGIKGLENTVNFYKSWFEFLESVAQPEAVAVF